jgi:hypothetical protein
MRCRLSALLLAILASPLPAAVFTPPACDGSGPGDVLLASPYCPWVQQFTKDGITAGCGGGNYCPDDAVTRQQLAVMMERAMRGTATWDPAFYVRTVMVHPVPGDPTASGNALLAAMASITTNTATNPYLLKIEPGIYDLGTGALTLKPYVDVEGSGELVTTIRSSGSASATTGTVVGANNCELRMLTIKNTGGGTTYAKAVYNSSADPFMSHVTLSAAGADFVVAMSDVNSSPLLYDVTISATSATTSAIGTEDSGSSFPLLSRARIAVTGSLTNIGLTNNGGGTQFLSDVSLLVNGGGGNVAIGVGALNGSSPIIRDSSFNVVGATDSWAIQTGGTAGSVTVEHSILIGSTASINNAASYTVSVAGSRIAGPLLNSGGGTFQCFGNYDGLFAAATCP